MGHKLLKYGLKLDFSENFIALSKNPRFFEEFSKKYAIPPTTGPNCPHPIFFSIFFTQIAGQILHTNTQSHGPSIGVWVFVHLDEYFVKVSDFTFRVIMNSTQIGTKLDQTFPKHSYQERTVEHEASARCKSEQTQQCYFTEHI